MALFLHVDKLTGLYGKGGAEMAGSSDSTVSRLKPVKWYRDLLKIKGRLESGVFLIEGDRAIAQVIGNHPDAVLEILTVEETTPVYRNFATRSVTTSQIRYISSTKTPQGTIAVVRIPADTYSSTLPGKTGDRLLLMEDIQDPGNTGTLIRTAAAFGFSGIIMTDKCADPFSPKCVQATAGAGLSVWIRRTGRYMEITGELIQQGFTLAAADLGGTEDPSVLSRKDKLILALGNEASGLSAKLLKSAAIRVKVPIARGKIDSLNVAACGAICMYLASKVT
jgi:TrmH family RNA methyltransferase